MDSQALTFSSTTDRLDPALRVTVERLLSGTTQLQCYRKLCRDTHTAPDAIYQLLDGLTDQLRAKDELIKSQSRTIERLRHQLVELVKECTIQDRRPRLQ